MVLWILLGVALVVGGSLGVIARMPVRQIVAQVLAMSGAVLLFYGLVHIL